MRSNADSVLEERDVKYDAMLSQMAGRIKTKPGGKLEMGEVSLCKLLELFTFILSVSNSIECFFSQMFDKT